MQENLVHLAKNIHREGDLDNPSWAQKHYTMLLHQYDEASSCIRAFLQRVCPAAQSAIC